jgi:hypothetical protein
VAIPLRENVPIFSEFDRAQSRWNSAGNFVSIRSLEAAQKALQVIEIPNS